MDKCSICEMELLPRTPGLLEEPCPNCGSNTRIMMAFMEETIGISTKINITIVSYLTHRNKENCSFKYRVDKENYKEIFNFPNNLISSGYPEIYIHDDFINGDNIAKIAGSKLIDCKKMNTNERAILLNFFNNVFLNNLSGTNKPSWHYENGSLIDKGKLQDYWHYHVGPYSKEDESVITSLNDVNWDGNKSGPVIHYLKTTKDEKLIYIIVAFTIEHSKKEGEKDGFKEKSKIIH